MTRSTEHPHVVVGCGDVGVATLYRLSRAAGPGVLGLDAAPVDRPRDQSVGRAAGLAQPTAAETRLALEAYDGWRHLERASGQHLLTETGGLLVAADPLDDPDGAGLAALADHVRAADRADLDFDVLDAAAIAARWPQIRLRGGERGLFQRRGGVLGAARAHATHLALARGQGAETAGGTTVRALHLVDDHVEVVTDDAVLRARDVVVAAGAATEALVAGLGPAPALEGLRTITETVVSCATPRLLDFSTIRFPALSWHGADTIVGLPVHGSVGTTLTQPGTDPAETAARRARFLAAHLPGFAGPECTTSRSVGVTRDGRPVVGRLRTPAGGDARVVVAAGTGSRPVLAAALGRALADLATTGTTRRPVAAFDPARGALPRPAAHR